MDQAVDITKGHADVFDDLKTALLELARELERVNVPLMLGGGYGLFLRQQELETSEEQTIIPRDHWPEPRSTQDLDLFMRSEVIADPNRWKAVHDALETLVYKVTEHHEYWQFAKQLDASKTIIVDLLTGPLAVAFADKVSVDKRRARPKARPPRKGDPGQPKILLHARLASEAVALESMVRTLKVTGTLSDMVTYTANIELPHPFPYLTMKLTAFDDRKQDPKKNLATHHALDIYRIVAMLTEREFQETQELYQDHFADPAIERVQSIAMREFVDQNLGIQRLREHKLGRNLADEAVREFQKILSRLFPGS